MIYRHPRDGGCRSDDSCHLALTDGGRIRVWVAQQTASTRAMAGVISLTAVTRVMAGDSCHLTTTDGGRVGVTVFEALARAIFRVHFVFEKIKHLHGSVSDSPRPCSKGLLEFNLKAFVGGGHRLVGGLLRDICYTSGFKSSMSAYVHQNFS